MTEPSEAALQKACEVLNWIYPAGSHMDSVTLLARHFDAEDKAAREALGPIESLYTRLGGLEIFAQRFILPDPKPTVADVVEAWRGTPGRTSERLSAMLRDAGLLRE